jgi:hypothetical protein
LRRALARLAHIAGQAPALAPFADAASARQLNDAARIAAACERLAADLPWPPEVGARASSSLSSSQTLPTRIVGD